MRVRKRQDLDRLTITQTKKEKVMEERKEMLDQVGRVYLWASVMFVFVLGICGVLIFAIQG